MIIHIFSHKKLVRTYHLNQVGFLSCDGKMGIRHFCTLVLDSPHVQNIALILRFMVIFKLLLENVIGILKICIYGYFA